SHFGLPSNTPFTDLAGLSIKGELTAAQPDTTTTLASSVNPSVFGQSVTFTATVSALLVGQFVPPTGTVTFFDGATPIGTGSLNTAGGVTTATFTTSTLAVAD